MSRKRKNMEDELEPTKKLISDGDLLVKSLLEKQLSTHVDLQTELRRQKTFISSTKYKLACEYVSGINTLNEVEKTSQYMHSLTEFTDAGLSEEDMIFHLNKDRGIEYFKSKHKNLDMEFITKRIAYIDNILNQHRGKKYINESSSNSAGRLQTECMLSVKPNSIETNLLKFALNNVKKTNDVHDETDPFKALEKDFTKCIHKESEPNVNIRKLQKKVQRQLRNISKRIEAITVPTKNPTFDYSETSASNSKWDIKDTDLQALSNNSTNGSISSSSTIGNSVASKTTSSGNRYTIRNGTIIKLEKVIDFKQCKKLSIEEIKNIPKFSEYTAGLPSKILYLKNTHSLSAIDLELLFKTFNFNTKSINVMKGRMKGQAFVEMENCQLAEQALEQINGIIVKDKPVIIHFSTKTALPKKDQII